MLEPCYMQLHFEAVAMDKEIARLTLHQSADEPRKLVISDRRSVFACCKALRVQGWGAWGFGSDIAACLCRVIM